MLRFRKHINSLVTIGLSCWMMFISMGFSMNLHLCQNQIKTFSVIGELEDCQTMTSCSSKKHCELMTETKADCSKECQDDCCSEQSIWLKSDHEQYKINTENIVPESTIQFLIAFAQTLQSNLDSNTAQAAFADYSPPPLISNIYKAVQSFRC